MIETVVEELPKVDPAASYFVEVDGERLKLKRFVRGKGPFVEYLRSTGLPVGTYEVVGKRVVHRHDPATVIAELRQHQQALRMQSRAFADAVRRIAASVGGKVAKARRDLGDREGFVYSITPRRGATINLAKLQKLALADGAVVFYDNVDKEKLAVVCADQPLDALLAWYGQDRELFTLLDAACGIERIEHMRARSVELWLRRAPAKPAPIVRALQRSVPEGEGSNRDAGWKRQLAARRLFVWWDL